MHEDVEKWLKEIKKGATRYSILTILVDNDLYGYELRNEFELRTKGVMTLTEGNTYPTLHKMESEGLVTSYWEDSEEGLPSRKYYHITEKGKTLLNEMMFEWNRYVEAMNNLWSGKNGNK
jgi:PadR family transcriptional regulator PadR